MNSRPDAGRWLQIEGCCNTEQVPKHSGQLVALFLPRADLGGKVMEPANFYFSTQTDWGMDSQNNTEISVRLKTEMEPSRQRGDFDAKASGSLAKLSSISSPEKASTTTYQRSKLYCMGKCE